MHSHDMLVGLFFCPFDQRINLIYCFTVQQSALVDTHGHTRPRNVQHVFLDLVYCLSASPTDENMSYGSSEPSSLSFLFHKSDLGSDFTNTLLEEWSKVPINTLLNLVESLPRELKLLQLQRMDRHNLLYKTLHTLLRHHRVLCFVSSGSAQPDELCCDSFCIVLYLYYSGYL